MGVLSAQMVRDAGSLAEAPGSEWESGSPEPWGALTLGVLAWSLQGQQRGCMGPALGMAFTMVGAVDHIRRPL